MQDKRKKRQERLKLKQRHASYLGRMRNTATQLAQIPRFIYSIPNEANTEFIEVVKQTLESIDFEDTNLFKQAQIEFFRCHRRYGWDRACQLYQLKDDIRLTGLTELAFTKFSLQCMVGHVLFKRLPDAILKKYVPYNDALVAPIGHGFHVLFRGLCMYSVPHEDELRYYSQHKPTITICGITLPVAFKQHVIDRVKDRIAGDVTRYSTMGDVFAFFDQCNYFEPCKIFNDQQAFTFYDECRDGFFTNKYVHEMVPSPESGKKYYFRIGYCPVKKENGFWVAKTLLPPGYRSTPEFDLILRSSRRKELTAKMENLSRNDMWKQRDLSLIKWFHDNGVSQVKAFDIDLYSNVLDIRPV